MLPSFVLILIAAVIGSVGGIYGIGGGAILAPILIGSGRPPAEVAPATLASTFVTSVGVSQHSWCSRPTATAPSPRTGGSGLPLESAGSLVGTLALASNHTSPNPRSAVSLDCWF